MDRNLFDLLFECKVRGFNLIKDRVDYIISNNIVDSNYIEHTLDYLIDFCYDEKSESYYYRICDYYKNIDKKGASFYLNLFKKTYK